MDQNRFRIPFSCTEVYSSLKYGVDRRPKLVYVPSSDQRNVEIDFQVPDMILNINHYSASTLNTFTYFSRFIIGV